MSSKMSTPRFLEPVNVSRYVANEPSQGRLLFKTLRCSPYGAELQPVEKQGEGNVPPGTADTSETHVPAKLSAGRQAPESP